jgi:hypothetical protein
MPSKIINIGLRFAQAVFGSVVLALSITLIKGQRYGMSPAATNYSSFVGAFTLLGAIIGLASTWIEFLQSFIGIGIDALILLFNLAGGVVSAAHHPAFFLRHFPMARADNRTRLSQSK